MVTEDIPYVEVLEDWADPLWRIQNIYWVLTDEGVEVPFRLRPEQLQYLSNLAPRNCCLKSRQHGLTTAISILQLDHSIFIPNFKAVTICETMDKAIEIFRTKIEYPWKKLPPDLRAMYPVITDSKTELVWGHGSSISVATSARSGTLQSLHVSEFGPIAAKHPEKAREIINGSFPAVTQSTGIIHVESTGKGQGGRFFDMVNAAMKLDEEKRPLTALDFRLHFFAWWQKKANVLDPTHVFLTKEDRDYFRRLEDEHQIFLAADQKAWYVKTKESLGEDMKSEHPSYPKEAFEVVIEGAILGHEMTLLRKMGRISNTPWVPRLAVQTSWDFGVDDATTIWFHQRVGGMDRLISYFKDQGRGLGYYVNEMNSRGYTFGKHYIPHDGNQRMQAAEVTTKKAELAKLGIRNTFLVPRTPTKNLAIDALRSFLLTCEIDSVGCVDGIRDLDMYQREWDEKLSKFKDTPRHDDASHGADALMQLAQGYNPDRDRKVMADQPDDILEEEVGY